MPRTVLASIALLVAACGGSTASSPGAGDSSDASVDASSNACTQMGGVCERTAAENMSCANLSGTYYEVKNFCGAVDQTCCVKPDSDGHFPPPIASYRSCGPILCPPGTACSHGTDFVQCVAPTADAGARD